MAFIVEIRPQCDECHSILRDLIEDTEEKVVKEVAKRNWAVQYNKLLCDSCLLNNVKSKDVLASPPEHFQGRGSIFDVNNGKVLYSFKDGSICIGRDICSDEIRWCCWVDYKVGYVIEAPDYDEHYVTLWLEDTGLSFKEFLDLVMEYDIWERGASEAGHAAYMSGSSREANPYSEEEEKYWSWDCGWDDARLGTNNYASFIEIKDSINSSG